jgi:hypothetical protein
MTRGTYGPLNRDRHPIASWTTNQAVDYAHDRTVGAVLRPVLPAVDDVLRGRRAAQHVWTAMRGIGGRAEAEKPAAQIGQELFHTVGDRDRAVAHLTTSFHALMNDLSTWLTANQSSPDASTIAHWIDSNVTPVIADWTTFSTQEKNSWWRKAATSWDTFEHWWGKLKQLRDMARVHGVELHSVEPAPLPKTIWQHSEAGEGSEATAVLGVLKIGVLSIIGIMGVIGLYSSFQGISRKAHAEELHHLRMAQAQATR